MLSHLSLKFQIAKLGDKNNVSVLTYKACDHHYGLAIFPWNCYCVSLVKSKHWRENQCDVKERIMRKMFEDQMWPLAKSLTDDQFV